MLVVRTRNSTNAVELDAIDLVSSFRRFVHTIPDAEGLDKLGNF